MLTIVQGVFWIFKTIMTFMGAKEDQLRWLNEASENLHKMGWKRTAMITEIDENQNEYIEAKVRALMKDKQSNIEPLRLGNRAYDMPLIKSVDVDIQTQGQYKTKSGKALGLVVHYTAGRMEQGDANAIATLKDMAARGLGCLVMSSTGTIFKARNQDLDEVGWHAGKSEWKKKTGVSQYCMGMEICCPGLTDSKGTAWFGGKYSDIRTVTKKDYGVDGTFVKYTPEQEKALIDFCMWQIDTNPEFNIDWVVGHHEIAPGRKSDPGGSLSLSMPAFRWMLKQKAAKGI